ncbi:MULTISPECIES: RagB/SusD family nutrient uptake outer membrane protein [Niastella]|uniref:RagB/SusD family nutrient uptake outer membrane protein n=1 Tax=Niastella soli TaxID=2821487 RepID=A0ABS3Z2N4_9BACT|nr:RagB/SusD family nutrient uptake outer membrane protein [Niastella soli]MBO9204419.1 RagB/SusD family nutrient uptake outer membrane protein [Niastella soli]
MKRYAYILLATLTTGSLSCKKSFLDEKPSSFLSTSNAFKTEADFNASINDLYGLVRSHFYTVNDFNPFWYEYRTDAYYDATATAANLPGEIAASATAITNFAWGPNYKIVEEANTIIHRLPASTLTAAQQTLFEAKARFFRGLAYRTLGYLYGGVPLNLNEIETPKTDFTRATRSEVYAQVEQDLEFAAANLPDITKVKDGEISNAAAYHLLAEVYNTDKQYQKAVDAASAVINNPAFALMTTRFGTRKTVTPGDVYWDLFQRGNQNRHGGINTEGIWVIQIETDVPGGGGSTTGGSQFGVYAAERVHAPLVRDLKSVVNGQQVGLFNWPMGDYTGGRGVGFLAPSYWFSDTVWQSDFNNDIRNANNNFVREFVSNNPKSPFYGQKISTINPPAGLIGINGNITKGKWDRAFYPYQSKCSQAYDYPTSLYVNPTDPDPVQKYALKAGAGGTYIDQYFSRLAETYLLRAEAYVGLSNPTSAAADINKVRSRANALPVSAANVNLDYILDERLRELGIEEKRMLTLMRLGLWVARTRKCNPFYGPQMKDNYNLWPIPVTEIEKNNTAVLEQNPGY